MLNIGQFSRYKVNYSLYVDHLQISLARFCSYLTSEQNLASRFSVFADAKL